MPRALLSVSDKTGIVELARGLVRARFRAGVHRRHRARADRCRPAGDERFRRHRLSRDDGRPGEDAPSRAARRHPRAARPCRTISAALDEHGIGLVDVVVVNLYPFVKAARTRRRRSTRSSRKSTSADRRWSAPPRRISAACSSSSIPADYARLLAALDRRAEPGVPFRPDAQGVRAHRRSTTRRSRDARRRSRCDGDRVRARGRQATAARRRFGSRLEKIRDLRYGENPHQQAAWYGAGARRVRASARPRILQGKELSYTNLLDLDAAVAHRARVRRAGGRRHQAHESVRRGDRRRRCRRLRARARRRPACPRSAASSALNRAARRRDGRSDRRRRSSRPSSRRRSTMRREPILAKKGEHARRGRRLRRDRERAASSSARFSARCSCRSATSSAEARHAVERRARCRRVQRRDQAAADGGRVGRRCGSPGASAPT